MTMAQAEGSLARVYENTSVVMGRAGFRYLLIHDVSISRPPIEVVGWN